MNDDESIGTPPEELKPERKPEDNTATEAEKDEREEAGEKDKAASRKATEGSRGKRQRGGGLSSEGSP